MFPLSSFITTIMTLVFVWVVTWATLSIASIRFQSGGIARRAYTSTTWRCLILMWSFGGKLANWLWKGHPHSGAAYMSSPPRLTSRDDER